MYKIFWFYISIVDDEILFSGRSKPFPPAQTRSAAATPAAAAAEHTTSVSGPQAVRRVADKAVGHDNNNTDASPDGRLQKSNHSGRLYFEYLPFVGEQNRLYGYRYLSHFLYP